MKLLVLILASVVSISSAFGQSNPQKRIALTSASNVTTGEVARELAKHCPEIKVTVDASKADYTLEAKFIQGTKSGNAYQSAEFTLFSLDGDVLFSTSTMLVKNAVKDVCSFIETGKKKK
jgi:hypothetical protein